MDKKKTYAFLNPKPPTLLRHNNNAVKRQRSWPVDRYDITGGAFPPRPDINCGGCPGKQYDNRNYTNNFLRTQAMLQNPVALCSMKNTVYADKLLLQPKIKLKPAKFTHGPGRSTSFLRVPSNYKTGFCKINENLTNHDRITRALEYKKIRDNFEMSKKMHAGNKRVKLKTPSMQSSEDIFEETNTKSEDSLFDICKRGELLEHVRKNVVKDVRRRQLEDEERKQFRFPTEAEIRLEIDHFNTNPNDFPPERYAYDPDAGMAMMCAKRQILARFHESPSETSSKRVKPEESKILTSKFQPKHFKLNDLTASTFDIFKKAPTTCHRCPKTLTKPYLPHSHLGLVETCNEDALKKARYILERRERDFEIPEEFLKPMYGPVKGLPKDFKLNIPEYLAPNVPPSPEELKKVEEAMKNDRKLEKSHRKKGITRTGEKLASQHYTKSLIESDEEIHHPREITRLVFSKDCPKVLKSPDINSSDLLFCTVGQAISDKQSETYKKPSSWMRSSSINLSEEPSKLEKKYRKAWRLNLKESVILKSPQPTLSLSSFESDSLEEDDGTDDLSYIGTVDSREFLPYSDVAFSDIEIPINIPGKYREPSYKLLPAEEKSSPEERTSEESESYSEGSYDDDDDNNNEYEFEYEDDNEEKEKRTRRRRHKVQKEEDTDEITLLRSMFQTQMDLEHVFKSPSSRWKKLQHVEHVPAQVKLVEDLQSKKNRRDDQDQAYFWEKIFGVKTMKEMKRKERLTEAAAKLKLLSDPKYNETFDVKQQQQQAFKKRQSIKKGKSEPNINTPVDLNFHNDATYEYFKRKSKAIKPSKKELLLDKMVDITTEDPAVKELVRITKEKLHLIVQSTINKVAINLRS